MAGQADFCCRSPRDGKWKPTAASVDLAVINVIMDRRNPDVRNRIYRPRSATNQLNGDRQPRPGQDEPHYECGQLLCGAACRTPITCNAITSGSSDPRRGSRLSVLWRRLNPAARELPWATWRGFSIAINCTISPLISPRGSRRIRCLMRSSSARCAAPGQRYCGHHARMAQRN